MSAREKPIIFSGPMVRAILEDRKTVTRRIIKGAEGCASIYAGEKDGLWAAERFGDPAQATLRSFVPKDRMWVRETFYDFRTRIYTDRGMVEQPPRAVYRADGGTLLNGGKWKPSIHMPRWASRLTLEVVSVRAEHLQDITEEDVIAEGVVREWHAEDERWMFTSAAGTSTCPIEAFAELWESIHGGGTWETNPWVWRIEFRRVATGKDESVR